MHPAPSQEESSAGWLPLAGGPGFSNAHSFGTDVALAAAGGAARVPIIVPSQMRVQQWGLFNGDTASARSAEIRLYRDNGTVTGEFVSGTDASFSFTPGAASLRQAAVSSPGVRIPAGTYWGVLRNTHATNAFNIRRNSPPTIGGLFMASATKSGLSALGATIDLDTGWSSAGTLFAIWLEGLVIGRTSAF